MPMAWHEKLKRGWGNVMLAHEAMVLNQLQRQAGLVNRLVRKTQDGTLGRPSAEREDAASEAEEMGIRIGDENHYHAAPALKTEARSKAAMLALALAAGLLSGGAGLVAGRLLSGDDSRQSTPTIQDNTESRLEYDFRLVPPAIQDNTD